MHIRISLVMLLACTVFAVAGSATQTDWSGGPGVSGPVADFGNFFFLCSGIDFYSNPSNLFLLLLEHSIDENFGGVESIYSEDVNGDGHMDVLGASYSTDDITWWSNQDGFGTSWVEHTIDGSFDGAHTVYAADVNGDGDMDVLGAAIYCDEIAWWENENGSGTVWTKHTVDGDCQGACSVFSCDINGDGYTDVLGGALFGDGIIWWENQDGSGTNWVEHTVDSDFLGAASVYSSDINGDGYMDVLGAARDDSDITWWENQDGSGTNWVEHTVDSDFTFATSVYSADVNGDSYMDVLGAAWTADDITWWENEDGSGTSWVEHTIDAEFIAANSVYSEDLNGDGYMDVLGAARGDDEITWWENTDGSGTNWTEHIVEGYYNHASSVYSADVNGDGRMDILGSAYIPGEIAWWDLTKYVTEGLLESSILDTQDIPEWGFLDWTSQIPSGASVSFQIRASDDFYEMGEWSDPLINPGFLQDILMNGDRYVQYRVVLETTELADSTPVLLDLIMTWDPMGIEDGDDPLTMMLLPFSPNPSVIPTLRFCLPEPASVAFSIFDLSGRLIHKKSEEEYLAGHHSVLFGDVSPGIYFCRMTVGDFAATQRFVVEE